MTTMTKTVVTVTAKVTGTHNNQKVMGTHNNQIIEAAEASAAAATAMAAAAATKNQLKAETVVAVIMRPWCCDI